MSFGNRNNVDNGPSNNTFSAINFSHGDSVVDATRFTVSYFNKLMKISIAKKIGQNGDISTFDNDHQTVVYVSNTKAKMLHDLMVEMRDGGKMMNVCIELKNGLLKISNGTEFGSDTPCFSILTTDNSGNVEEIVYQTKADFYQAAYDYKNGKFSTKQFDNMEFDTFLMTLDEYWKASSYALAATVMEASMYKRDGQYRMIKAIADKIGAVVVNNSGAYNQNGGGYNSRTFLNNNNGGGGNSSGGMNNVPEDYETSTFADIANSMGLS